MRYAVVSREVVDAIVSNPLDYLQSFEPIDILDGQTVVYSEDGGIFQIQGDFTQPAKNGRFATVDVGNWKDVHPQLVRVKQGQLKELRTILMHTLQDVSSRNHRHLAFFRKKQYESVYDYSTLSIGQLMIELERRLTR